MSKEVDLTSSPDRESKPTLNRVSWEQFLRFVDTPPRNVDKKYRRIPYPPKPPPPNKRSTNKSKAAKASSLKKQPASSKGTKAKAKKTTRKPKAGEYATWNLRYNELKAFMAANGHCRVPQRYSQNEKLGVWVKEQRKKLKQERLPSAHKKKLDEIAFVWQVRAPCRQINN